VLFMSGYSQDVGGSERAPDAGIALVQKPFTEQALLESVRAVIAAPGAVRPALAGLAARRSGGTLAMSPAPARPASSRQP